MTMHTITLHMPENLYLRLKQTAQATRQSLDDVALHVMQVGSPPNWDDIPPEFQADVAALDRLDDPALWRIVKKKMAPTVANRYQQLLDQQAEGTISAAESRELIELRMEADRTMLCKAQAAALLRWRGHPIPPAEKL